MHVLLAWRADPIVITGCFVACLVYWLYTRGARSAGYEPDAGRDRLFGFAIGLIVLDVLSPLDYLAEHYLFSAHMLQHMVLILAVAPLLVISTPAAFAVDVRRFLPAGFVDWLTHPIIAFVLSAGYLWAWESPGLFQVAVRNGSIHLLEHVTLAGSFCLFWWVALAPSGSRHHRPIGARLALVLAGALALAFLGASLTFTTQVAYPVYQTGLDSPGLGQAIERATRLVPLADQQLGGLIMWAPGVFFYLMVMVGMFLRWAAAHQAAGGELPGLKRLTRPPRRERPRPRR